MFTSVSSLINSDKISYDCLEDMINSDLIKNLFTKTGTGKIKKIEGNEDLENMFMKSYDMEILNYKGSIATAKINLKNVLKHYKDYYAKSKEKYNRWGYEQADIIKNSGEELKQMFLRDDYDFKYRLDNLKKAKKELKRKDMELKAKKTSFLYYNLLLYSYEYERAKEEYVKKILENSQAKNKGGKDDSLPF